MSAKELAHLRRAAETARKLLRKPVIEAQQPEPEPQQRPIEQSVRRSNSQ